MQTTTVEAYVTATHRVVEIDTFVIAIVAAELWGIFIGVAVCVIAAIVYERQRKK